MVNGLDWQCCFAGSFKTAARILIFSIAVGCRLFIWAEFHWDLSPHIFFDILIFSYAVWYSYLFQFFMYQLHNFLFQLKKVASLIFQIYPVKMTMIVVMEIVNILRHWNPWIYAYPNYVFIIKICFLGGWNKLNKFCILIIPIFNQLYSNEKRNTN